MTSTVFGHCSGHCSHSCSLQCSIGLGLECSLLMDWHYRLDCSISAKLSWGTELQL